MLHARAAAAAAAATRAFRNISSSPTTRASSSRMVAVLSQKRKANTIGTHSGTFHCDEALGCFLLRQTPEFRDADVVRSRDPAVLADLDVIIDVGGVYDPAARRFDHHQRGFSEVFGHGYATKLSSAGLVYKHYGKQIVADRMQLGVDHPHVQAVWLEVYRSFIEAVDAIDNGVNQYESDAPPRYVNNTGLSSRVGQLNPNWTEPFTDDELNERFAKAMALTGGEFLAAVDYVSRVWLSARDVVREALEARGQVDASGRIVRLGKGGVPWKEHLYQLERELGVDPPVLFVLYEDDRERKWRIQAVSVAPGSFENRRSLPAAWCGLRDEALSSASGVPGCVFAHASGFIGGNATYEGALEMARRAVAA